MAHSKDIYETLDLSTDSLRLLQVQSPSDEDAIRCTTHNATIGTEQYTAVSYMWHPESGRERSPQPYIRLNGQRLEVGPNLFAFLEVAQQQYAGQTLWIDRLCIDQSNHDERNHQVSQMHRIYADAKTTLIWLGRGTDSTKQLFEFINCGRWNSQRFMRLQNRLRNPSNPHSCSCSNCSSGPNQEEILILKDGLETVFQNPYWSRQWIIQEIFLASRIEIMMGCHRTAWGSLFRPMDIQEHAGSFEYQLGGNMMCNVRILKDNPDGANEPTDLPSLVLKFKDHDCADPRDRVHAMLGIARQSEGFVVDYARTLYELVQYAIEHTRSTDVVMIQSMMHALELTVTQALSSFTAEFLDRPFRYDQVSGIMSYDEKRNLSSWSTAIAAFAQSRIMLPARQNLLQETWLQKFQASGPLSFFDVFLIVRLCSALRAYTAADASILGATINTSHQRKSCGSISQQ
ncbi:hypothetical protein LTR37_012218 [Vermiconidia calcicola]|uniref:Uncharacterized protein n=1 Tax=Vermiconidia calcicola TaxID=1690605 RepID=A0ACC3MZR4_9PEZI|nr:hypothetical protein LTR37_012218 [Vermiconidia calcicola]